MKHKIKFTLLFFSILNYSFAQGLFKKVDLKDDFGDAIGTQLVNIAEGVFSNSATQNEFLVVKVTYKKAKENPSYDKYVENKLNDDSYYLYNKSKMYKKAWIRRDSKKKYEEDTSFIGAIFFEFFQYKDLQPYFVSDRAFNIQMKFSDGSKFDTSIVAPLRQVAIMGYKELSFDESPSFRNRNYKNTFYNGEIIYDEYLVNKLASENEPVEMVIYNGTSKFQFTLFPQGE